LRIKNKAALTALLYVQEKSGFACILRHMHESAFQWKEIAPQFRLSENKDGVAALFK